MATGDVTQPSGDQDPRQAGILRRGEAGRPYRLGSMIQTLLVPSDAMSGHFEVWETWLPPGASGPSAHVHDALDKVFYVTEGRIEFIVGDHVEIGDVGCWVTIPRGTAHTFANSDTVPARFLMIETPSGRETMFKEMADALPSDAPPDPHVMDAILRKYDTRPA